MVLMGLSLVKCLLISLVFLFQFHGYWGCMDGERMGLLEFKNSINWTDTAEDHRLPSWVDDRGSDCCAWERVKCNPNTGRVIQLSLSKLSEYYYYEYERPCIWHLNVTSFLPLEELQHLNLSYNGFYSWPKSEGFDVISSFKRLARWKKLEVLDLSYNGFNNDILPFLGSLVSLKTLSLNSNILEGSRHLQELTTLNNLQSLDLGGNSLNGSISIEGIESNLSFKGWKKLEVLDLSYNDFDNDILPFLASLKSLKTLSLGENRLHGSLPFQELATLQNLQSLDLSWNIRNGSLKGFEHSSSFKGWKKLEVLDLSYNEFNNNILPFLSSLISLKTLSLSGNRLNGSLPLQALANLTNLEVLNLSDNLFNGSLLIPELATLHNLQSLDLGYNRLNGSLTLQDSERLSRLSMLEYLDLSNNDFDKSILQLLAVLPSLKTLLLTENRLEGPLGTQELANLSKLEVLNLRNNLLNGSLSPGFCELKKLQLLDLSWNNLEGILPPCLNNFMSLEYLDLSHNQFKGNVSSSLASGFTSLKHISLAYNHFEGTFSFSSFANSSKLELVDLQSAGSKLEVETEYPPWVPSFQLKTIILPNCNVNKLTNAIPKFLSRQYDLREIDLSHNNLKGRLPFWLFENVTRLETLKLRNNSFEGPFLSAIQYQYESVLNIDFSSNRIQGKLPMNIGETFPNLQYLNLSGNDFHGGIPSSIGYMKSLVSLDFSNNNFSGEIPEHLAKGCNGLEFLKLSKNSLHGQIFPTYFNLTSLRILHLDNNQFTGNILDGLSKCSQLNVLDIGYNQISGKIPNWISNLTSLETLIMKENLFKGDIPLDFCQLRRIYFLDLSQNNLSGSIPSCLNTPYLEHVHLQGNEFKGSLSQVFLNSSNLLTLDIRDNSFTGTILNWIGAFSSLRVLLLNGNHLHGPLPNHLCQLKNISLMDLSQNTFSGSIPRCFNNITFGRIEDMEMPYMQQMFYTIFEEFQALNEVEFTTKRMYSSYKGNILNFMSGLDLSCNLLTGDIPHEIGDLSGIHALNLSHNYLSGEIPKTLSNLRQIESLDLSFNSLSGEIPSELIGLYFLEVFSVAHNNLSGKTPDTKSQFGTFDYTSYEGNRFLCGPPLQKKCNVSIESVLVPTTQLNKVEKNKYYFDLIVFFTCFAASYIIFLLGFGVVLYINPYWRRMWFHFVNTCILSCGYFISDTLSKSSTCCFQNRTKL